MSQSSPIPEVQSLRDSLIRARQLIINQDAKLKELTSPPLACATVLLVDNNIDKKISSLRQIGTRVRVITGEFKGEFGVVAHFDGDVLVRLEPDSREEWFHVSSLEPMYGAYGTVIVSMDGKLFQVVLPSEKQIAPGDTVTVSMESMQIVDLASLEMSGGIAFVRRIPEDKPSFVEVDSQGTTKLVRVGKFNFLLEVGDRVVLDKTESIVLDNLGKMDERFSFNAETRVSWEDIGGLEDAKRLMIEAVELPHSRPELFSFYGRKPVKGILLYGPPGCGKTMLGKATATSLARTYNGNASSSGFLYVKGPEILDKYVGVAEATIRQIFARARKHFEENGYPAVIFIDEADAILGKRGSGISSDVERTIVPMFLTEMDGLEDSGALVILATNRPDILDPAIVRDGRVDRKIKVDRPSHKSAVDIFKLALRGVPLDNGYSHSELSELGCSELFSDKYSLYEITRKGSKLCFNLRHLCSGAMVVGIVDQAASIALHRDLAEGKRSGLRKEDLISSVSQVFAQNRDLNHSDELAEFVYDFRNEVQDIRKLRQQQAA